MPGRIAGVEPKPFPFTGDGCCAALGLVGVLPCPAVRIFFLIALFVITNVLISFTDSNYKCRMISKRFGRKPKGKDNTGRSTKVTSIMISQDLKDRLSELKDAYECCYNENVTYDQMLARWADNVGRFDPKVPGCLEAIRGERKKEQERMDTGLGITAEQLKENDPAVTENEPWELRYIFKKDGEEVEAYLGDKAAFYAKMDGRSIGMAAMMKDGWTLMNEVGVELDINEAWRIHNIIKAHLSGESSPAHDGE